MENFYKKLENLLKKDNRFVDKEGELLKSVVVDCAYKADNNLVELLLSEKEIREKFFSKIKDISVFNINDFVNYIQDKNFLANSFTKYKNKIGLNIDGKFLNEHNEVALVWPFKDCVLEGGMTKEDEKRKEIFFNEILAQDEIDKLFAPKVLTNWKRYTAKGEEKVKELKRDKDGTIRENLIIKGNNLLALHSLKSQFAGKVKLIYIDPPYNPRSDANTFAYNNNFNHSTWLTFMKNRLEVARELLTDDGLIFIDIDHYELFYLGVLADEIFGYENRIGVLAVVHNYGGRFNEFFANAHENKIVYAKNKNNAKIFDFKMSDEKIRTYSEKDEISNFKLMGLRRTGDGSRREDRPNLFYPIFVNPKTFVISLEPVKDYVKILPIDPDGVERRWRWGKEKVSNEWKTELVIKKNKDVIQIYTKDRYFEGKGEKPKSIWIKPEYAGISGTNELKKLLGEKVFAYPKSMFLVKDTISIATEKNNSDIVLDFFGGSGTTAHAVLQLNKEDGGNRKFILCEQMDYVENVTAGRVKEVVKNNKNDNFMYCELAKYNEEFVEKIQKAKDGKALLKIWGDMKEKGFLNYNVDIKKFNETIEEFKKLSIEKQREILFETLNKNQLYVNLSEINDVEFKVAKEDKELNKEFYK